MKFTVGYQYFEDGEESFADIVKDFRFNIEEIYFPWLDQPSARSPATSASGLTDWEGKDKLMEELKQIKEMNIRLDLLFNANCYGEKSLSRELINTVRSIISYLDDETGLDVVTTTSLIIAEAVKKYFPHIEVRASINMRIGTLQGMGYVKDLFDSFCLQREYNRDAGKLGENIEWCEVNEKKICLLANSGCLNFCPAQTFHDNLVAHLKEINERKNWQGYNPILCQSHYSTFGNWVSFLQDSSWIRPEDINNYERKVPLIKLATRTHQNPRQVIQAYARGKFAGNLLDLTEPGHGGHFKGYIVDNTLFPKDWFNTTFNCKGKCNECNYCEKVMEKVLVKMGNMV